MPRLLSHPRGFTIVELTVVLVIVSLILGGFMLSLTATRDVASLRDTQRQLTEIKDALLGFSAANGRLPCPASGTSNGLESFCTNDTGGCGALIIPPTPMPGHGRCSNPFDGFLPAVTLGLSGLDANGYALDSWGTPASRFRYALADGTINGITHPFSAASGMKNATMASISVTTPLLSVCSAADGISGGTCTAATMLTNSAVAVIFSPGSNAMTGGTGADEAANLDGDAVFVSHPTTTAGAAGGEFDDLVLWISPNLLFNRLIAAGKLP